MAGKKLKTQVIDKLKNLQFDAGDPFADTFIHPDYQTLMRAGDFVLVKIGKKTYSVTRTE